MKNIYFVFLITLFFCFQVLWGQNNVNIHLPASKRTDKITAQWFDRANFVGVGERPEGDNILWYRQSAKVWEEALPIGNGQLGAMIFGGVADERIQFNESTLWDGYSLDPNNSESLRSLPEIQKLLFEGKNENAVKLAEQSMMGNPKGVKPFQSLGELWFDTPHFEAKDYTRSLDIENAITSVCYTNDDVKYVREVFASAVDNVIVIKLQSDKKAKINLKLKLRRDKDAQCSVHPNDSYSLLLKGKLPIKDQNGDARGLSFAMQVKAVVEKGMVISENEMLDIKDADSVTLYISGATNYPGLKGIRRGERFSLVDPVDVCSYTIKKATRKSYKALKDSHIKEYRNYYDRVKLDLGSSTYNRTLPTDELLELAQTNKKPDLGLVETFFQYGRYLLISSSRPGTMPANLQGLWAWQMNPPWNADYHTNINFQMNYWPAEITNLSEMHLPMFDLMEAIVPYGQKTAKTLYGANGWVVHHLTDVWGYTAPADGPQGIWPMGAAWLAQHPWEHYCHNQNKVFLKEKAYPIMKGAAEFILDFLVEAPQGSACPGKLVTNPSHSPENGFILPDGKGSVFTYGATMDTEIIHDLLTNCIEAGTVLGIDESFRNKCAEALKQLVPIRISKETGRIMEWIEDYKEIDLHHRHTSHLFALHPGNQISVTSTPELAEAARKTLEARGDGGTGWSLAWKINMWNRLHDGNRAYKLLSELLASKTLPNLFDNHPPFQIDGNFGATAAIAEMFLQSQVRTDSGGFEVHLLPSLPDNFPNGTVRGLKARGGVIVDITWKNGVLTKATIKPLKNGKVCIRYNEKYIELEGYANKNLTINNNLQKQ